MEPKKVEPDTEALRTLKHDIRNQLSNIHLALEQLRHEVPDPTADYLFYIDTLAASAAKIDSLLKQND